MTQKDLINNLINEGFLKTPVIIKAFYEIDRADFILPEYKNEAYGNYPLPIGYGQTISQPLTVAFMLELLQPQPGDKILDIGSGSGWTTALLANIVGSKGELVAIERIPELCEFAKKNIDKYEFIKHGAVKFYCQDATEKLPDGPYDKIIAAAAASKEIPTAWRDNLKIGGRIVAPIDGSVWLFIKKADNQWEEKEYPGFAFVPLIKDKGLKTKDKSLNLTKKILSLALVFSLAAFGLLVNEIYRPHTSYKNARAVEIPIGLGSRQIASFLKKEGVLRSKRAFEIYVFLKGLTSNLKPGDYVFGQETIPEIVRDLAKGETNERVITIPEGWSTKEIAEYLEKEKITQARIFQEFTNSSGAKIFTTRFDFLQDKPAQAGLEGYLFPDTYRIFKNATAEDIVIRMLKNFGKKLSPDLKQAIARQKKTIFQIITMASLIEKEVITDKDRVLVSGILWKRLNLGIGLQVDATITYLSGKKSTKVSIEDTKINSPYNTYKYRGLPPGPISNPGLSSIRAAIYPQESPYLYYLSTADGKTIFSKTLEEHNIAKAKYLKI